MASTLTQTVADATSHFTSLKLTGEGEPPSHTTGNDAAADPVRLPLLLEDKMD